MNEMIFDENLANITSIVVLASVQATMAEGHQAKWQKLNPKTFLPSDTSFEQAMKDKTFFADKSHLIPFIEEERNVIFCRPRRFGKSLILQMLMTYFDKNTDDTKFNEVFFFFKKFK